MVQEERDRAGRGGRGEERKKDKARERDVGREREGEEQGIWDRGAAAVLHL